MKTINIAWIFPILLGSYSILLTVCKGAFESSSKLTILGAKMNWLIMTLRQTCQLAFVAVLHYWINKGIMHRLKIKIMSNIILKTAG